jgi:hypothetical protein
METNCKDEEDKKHFVNLITHFVVESVRNNNANAIVPTIESVEEL